jgi:hypothetical protein
MTDFMVVPAIQWPRVLDAIVRFGADARSESTWSAYCDDELSSPPLEDGELDRSNGLPSTIIRSSGEALLSSSAMRSFGRPSNRACGHKEILVSVSLGMTNRASPLIEESGHDRC